jgi:hypothetical protein
MERNVATMFRIYSALREYHFDFTVYPKHFKFDLFSKDLLEFMDSSIVVGIVLKHCL